MARKKSDFEELAGTALKLGKKVAQLGFEVTKKAAHTGAELTKDYALLARRLSAKERFQLLKLKPYVSDEEFNAVKSLLKQYKLKIKLKRYGWSFLVSGKDLLPKLVSEYEEVKELEKRIRRNFYKERFEEFVERAWGALPQYIASDVIGLLEIKQALALQLFSTEPVHIILIGDKDHRKHSILESASNLAPASCFGDYKSTLGIFNSGKQIDHMLFSANSGLSCITDLHNIQPHEKAQLLNLIDKQFISYDSKKSHSRYDINTSILASANPINDKFESLELETIKSKLPFNSEFLSKFNLVFIVREINLNHFAEIAEKILTADKAKLNSSDIRFIQRYVAYARNIKVKIPPKLGEILRDFAVSLKQQEESSPFSITENTVSGILRLAKASARMELRDTIEAKDLERVFNIYNKALNFSVKKE